MVCSSCCERRGLSWEILKPDHHCQQLRMFVTRESHSNNNKWDKIRGCQDPDYKRQFRICSYFQDRNGACERKDSCKFAHSKTEVEFWNFERDELINVKDLFIFKEGDPLKSYGKLGFLMLPSLLYCHHVEIFANRD